MATTTHDTTADDRQKDQTDPLSIKSIGIDFLQNLVLVAFGILVTLFFVSRGGSGGASDVISIAGALIAFGAGAIPTVLVTLNLKRKQLQWGEP